MGPCPVARNLHLQPHRTAVNENTTMSDEDEAEPEPTPKSNKKLILFALIGLLVVRGAAGGC